jgi:hypothetical protein
VSFRPGPSRDVAPAGDLLFERPKRRQKVAPTPSPLTARGVPCDARNPRLAQNSLCYAPLKQLREVSRRSALRARLGLLRFSAPPKGSDGTAEQPTAKPDILLVRAVRVTPFSTAEERKVLRPRAQHASTTDSAQLFDRSVAKGVLRGASRLEYRREPPAQRAAVRSGVVSLPTFLSTQESRSPAGANSRHHARQQPAGQKA